MPRTENDVNLKNEREGKNKRKKWFALRYKINIGGWVRYTQLKCENKNFFVFFSVCFYYTLTCFKSQTNHENVIEAQKMMKL